MSILKHYVITREILNVDTKTLRDNKRDSEVLPNHFSSVKLQEKIQSFYQKKMKKQKQKL